METTIEKAIVACFHHLNILCHSLDYCWASPTTWWKDTPAIITIHVTQDISSTMYSTLYTEIKRAIGQYHSATEFYLILTIVLDTPEEAVLCQM